MCCAKPCLPLPDIKSNHYHIAKVCVARRSPTIFLGIAIEKIMARLSGRLGYNFTQKGRPMLDYTTGWALSWHSALLHLRKQSTRVQYVTYLHTCIHITYTCSLRAFMHVALAKSLHGFTMPQKYFYSKSWPLVSMAGAPMLWPFLPKWLRYVKGTLHMH